MQLQDYRVDVQLGVQAEDGYVHFGDVVQLASADSKAVVAINIAEKVICICHI